MDQETQLNSSWEATVVTQKGIFVHIQPLLAPKPLELETFP